LRANTSLRLKSFSIALRRSRLRSWCRRSHVTPDDAMTISLAIGCGATDNEAIAAMAA
jgi:hypothetical protein